MPAWRVELRAWPDTPREEEFAAKQGRVLGPQTVVYPEIWAETYEEACKLAVEYESKFLYRRRIVVFDHTAILQMGDP